MEQSDMMADTLAFLMGATTNDDRIKRLLKRGRQLMILRTVINLMPTQCTFCTKDYHYLVGEEPAEYLTAKEKKKEPAAVVAATQEAASQHSQVTFGPEVNPNTTVEVEDNEEEDRLEEERRRKRENEAGG